MAKLGDDYKKRKALPIGTGCVDYFPDALAAVAHVSYVATQQHHPGQPMHWDRSKSTDHADCLMRHFVERGTVDVDGMRHSAKMAWRALALLQLEIEANELVRQTANAGGTFGTAPNAPNGYSQLPSHSEVPDRKGEMVCASSTPEDDATGHF